MACDPDKIIDDPIAVAMKALAESASLRDKMRINADLIRAKELRLSLRLRELQAIPDGRTIDAWCADKTEDLEGEVATAEIPGEPEAVLVRPGYDDGAAYISALYGILYQRAGMSPEQVYFNAAILPGWQKFRPTYRFGVLTAVDHENNTGNVNLEESVSSAQNLGVNQSQSLDDVPIEYMECDSLAFDVGDRVLVEFVSQRWENPRVIGFAEEPKECCLPVYAPSGGLIHYWPLDEEAGSIVVDHVGDLRCGLVVNDTFGGGTIIAGQAGLGNARDLSAGIASGAYLDLWRGDNDNDQYALTEWTLTCLYRRDGPPDTRIVLWSTGTLNTNHSIRVVLDWVIVAGNRAREGLYVLYRDSQQYQRDVIIEPLGQLWDGEWHRVTVTCDGSTVRAYFDNSASGEFNLDSGSSLHIYPKSRPLLVGRWIGTGSSEISGNADVDEIAIFDRAVTPAQIGSPIAQA